MESIEYLKEESGFFGKYGGKYIPETIRPTMDELAATFDALKHDAVFERRLKEAYAEFSGRPTPFTPLKNLSKNLGAKIYMKNEGMNLTGAHKINHCIGQILLAQEMGKTRIIAETGAGQHGYATATVAARFGMKCTIYMGKKDYERQRPNVFWMELLGAEVIPVESGDESLNDAVIAAFKDLISDPEQAFYLLGSAVGPDPYPRMNAHFQSVVGKEILETCESKFGREPDRIYACVGGGSNALGAFLPFLKRTTRLMAIEAGGKGEEAGEHARRFTHGKPGVFEGYHGYFLQDEDGNISSTHSISAGLDYCGVSPLLSDLYDSGRIESGFATDEETLEAVKRLAKEEGLIIALESAHALAALLKDSDGFQEDEIIVLNGSGRGEKDLFISMKAFQPEALESYAKTLIKT